MSTKALDKESDVLIEENSEYEELLSFFEEEYLNTEELLDALKSSKHKLNGKINT